MTVSVGQLKNLKIFERSPERSLERLASIMKAQTFASGTVICKEGDVASGIFLIASGSVDVVKKIGSGDHESKKVARLAPEEFFGEMAFLEKAPYSATAVAAENTEVFVLPMAGIEGLLKQEPAVALDQILTLFSGLSARLRQTTGELVTLFEVAKIVGQDFSGGKLLRETLQHILFHFGPDVSAAFYLWNPFNDEYSLSVAGGTHKAEFSEVLELKDLEDLVKKREGKIISTSICHNEKREALFLSFCENPSGFGEKHKQLVETISGVLAPALVRARSQDEEKLKSQIEQGRQGRSIV